MRVERASDSAAARLLRRAGFAAVFAIAPHCAWAQPASSDPRPSLTGRIAEVFANRFILVVGQERLLVEPNDPALELPARAGEEVTVQGERFGLVVKAARIERTSAPAQAAAPPAAAGDSAILDALRRLDLAVVDAPVTKKHHIEVLARMRDGRSVYVTFDRGGRLAEIEDAVHDRDAAKPRNLARADYDRLAREAGFTPTGGFEERRRHVELEATNRAGEPLVLHFDKAGVIYKQVWPR